MVTEETNIERESSLQTLTYEDYEHIQKLTENAYEEVRSEGIQDIEVQIYSVMNRSRRWSMLSVSETIDQPYAYSWKVDFTKQEIINHKKEDPLLYDDISTLSTTIYTQYKDGSEDVFDAMPITRFHDHYITKRMARENPPCWYTHYCADKRRVGTQMYCIGIRPKRGENKCR